MTKYSRLSLFRFGVLLWAVMLSEWGLAADLTPFDPALPAQTHCLVPIEKLHPTQFAVGFKEVEIRAKNIARKNPAKLQDYLNEHLAQIVIGPEGEPYLIDGHHLALALQKTQKAEMVEAEVAANWRNMSREEFWKNMRERHWVYLYDHRGEGPLDPEKLPKKVSEMSDDPYRSLAWLVRKRGGYEKTTASFAEFKWAGFFRTRIALAGKSPDFKRAAEAALALCRTSEAKDLPGFKP